VVVDYDPRWEEIFSGLYEVIWPHVRDVATALEHVGSTAVPGLAAKPIIDMDIIVRSPAAVGDCIQRLTAIGYEYRGELGVPDRHAFRSPPGTPDHHLYICLDGSVGLRNHLLLRNHLRSRPEDARAYGELKRRLAERHRDDIDAYVDGKTEFIVEVLFRHGMGDRDLDQVRGENLLPSDEVGVGTREAIRRAPPDSLVSSAR